MPRAALNRRVFMTARSLLRSANMNSMRMAALGMAIMVLAAGCTAKANGANPNASAPISGDGGTVSSGAGFLAPQSSIASTSATPPMLRALTRAQPRAAPRRRPT